MHFVCMHVCAYYSVLYLYDIGYRFKRYHREIPLTAIFVKPRNHTLNSFKLIRIIPAVIKTWVQEPATATLPQPSQPSLPVTDPEGLNLPFKYTPIPINVRTLVSTLAKIKVFFFFLFYLYNLEFFLKTLH